LKPPLAELVDVRREPEPRDECEQRAGSDRRGSDPRDAEKERDLARPDPPPRGFEGNGSDERTAEEEQHAEQVHEKAELI
jgi:hypothetical protein